jgi:putative transcriptional regulator
MGLLEGSIRGGERGGEHSGGRAEGSRRCRSPSGTTSKRARNVGLEILEGLRQLTRGALGRITDVPSVARVREKTGLSQSRFAELLGVSVRTLQEWEQGRRAPSGAGRTLLLIAARNPRVLLDVA